MCVITLIPVVNVVAQWLQLDNACEIFWILDFEYVAYGIFSVLCIFSYRIFWWGFTDEVYILLYLLTNLYLHKRQIIHHCQPIFIWFFILSFFSLGINFFSYFKNYYSVFVTAKVTPGESRIRLAFVKKETSQNPKQIII